MGKEFKVRPRVEQFFDNKFLDWVRMKIKSNWLVALLFVGHASVLACDAENTDLETIELSVENPLQVEEYVHQVFDMDQSNFKGYNACGPTSAVTIVKHHKLQPTSPNSYPGYYVYNKYDDFADKSGNNYCCDFSRDWTGVIGEEQYVHPHLVPGAHGYIVGKNGSDWVAFAGKMVTYLTNHGLTSTNIETKALFKTVIEYNINNELPIIATISHPKTAGHYLIVVGYNDTGGVYVNDPAGNILLKPWPNENGEQVVYNLYDSPFEIKRVITAWPIGIWGEYPGWMQTPKGQGFPGDKYNLPDDYSQKFRDAWQAHLSSFAGEAVAPWDNGKSPYVHCWPDSEGDYYGNCEGNSNALMLQDFRANNGKWIQLVYNPISGQVYPTFGKILAFWHDNYGYFNYGAPKNSEEFQWISGIKWHVQEFQYGWIGSCQEYTEVRQVFPWEFDGWNEQSDLEIAGSSNSNENSNSNNSDNGSGLPVGWCENNNECPLYHYCVDNQCQTTGVGSASSPSSNSSTAEQQNSEVQQETETGDAQNNDNEKETDTPQIVPADNNNAELVSSTKKLSCQINCPKFNGAPMDVVIWYGLEQSGEFFASSEVFSIPYDQLCLWGEPSFEFNCVINGQYGWHEQANITCSELIAKTYIHQHTRVTVQNYNCFQDAAVTTGDPKQEENKKVQSDPMEDGSTDTSEEDVPADEKEKLICSIDCPKNNGVQLDVALWYEKNEQPVVKDSGAQFAIEYCELCYWGEPSFEFNCFNNDFWGLHEQAETSCNVPITKTYINQHTRVTVQNYECWPCWK